MLGRLTQLLNTMKSFSKTLTALFVLSFISFSAIAQSGMRGDRGAQQRDRAMDRLRDVPVEVRTEAHVAVFDEYLNLTDAQKTKLKEIDQKFVQRGQTLRQNKTYPQKKRVQGRALRNERRQAIHQLLTKEQYAVYLEKQEAIRYDIRQRLRSYNQSGN